MSRNKILTLIILATLLAFGLFYFWQKTRQDKSPQTTDGTGSFPFGNGGNQGGFSTSSPNSRSSSGQEENIPMLRQISSSPIAGGISFDRDGKTIIRYVDRGTGHIYETEAESLENRTLSNTTIPKVYEAIWSPKGQFVIARYLSEKKEGEISSFLINISSATTTIQDVSKNPKNVFLPSNLKQLAVNPSGSKIFYLIDDNSNNILGIVSEPDGSKKKQIFESPLKEWLASWAKDDAITLWSKPSYISSGHMFSLNEKTYSYNSVLGGITGLTVLPDKKGEKILYSEAVENSLKLRLYNSKTGKDALFSFKTLPEKCVWSSQESSSAYCAVPKKIFSAQYPDSWYQGLTSFIDGIWKINLETNATELISDIQSSTGNQIDAENLFLSEKEDYLFFTNKKDLTFWSLNLKNKRYSE